MPDQVGQSGGVARRLDDRVDVDAAPVGEDCTAGVQSSHRRHHLDRPVPDGVDDLPVDDRRSGAPAPELRDRTLGRRRKAAVAEVADHPALHEQQQPVDPCGGQVEEQRNRQVRGHPAHRPQQDVRRAAHRQAYTPRTAHREVVGDLEPGRAGADHQHVAVPERRRTAVVGCMHQIAAEFLATRPVRRLRSVEDPGRHDDVVRASFTPGGREPPAATIGGVQPGHLDAALHRDASAS